MTILSTRSCDKKWLRSGCRKKLVVLQWENRTLDGAMLKRFCFQVSVIIYRQQHYSSSWHRFKGPIFMRNNSNPLAILDICGLRYLNSTTFIDNKTILFLLIVLICLWLSWETVWKVTEWHKWCKKKTRQNNWQMLQHGKIERIYFYWLFSISIYFISK